jgi:hypothetical protein
MIKKLDSNRANDLMARYDEEQDDEEETMKVAENHMISACNLVNLANVAEANADDDGEDAEKKIEQDVDAMEED